MNIITIWVDDSSALNVHQCRNKFDTRKCKYLAFESEKLKARAVDIYIPDMGNLLIYISNMNVGP